MKASPSQTDHGLLRRVLSLGARLIALGIALTILWVMLYRVVPVPGTTLMGWRSMQGQAISRDWVPLDDISPQLVRAVIAAEDTGFCQHIGFDVEAIKVAIADARAGSGWRGASTISQQTAKNAFLWHGRDPLRKLAEVWFTGLQELIWSKRRIMEVYLNVAEWGDGNFGAEAAAQARFGKPALELTAYEASLLAAVLPSPNRWSANPPGPYVASRAETLRKRMATVRRNGLDTCIY
ncbi:monofunctional biosynthetic peptidoglycan transglycosylase [Parvularcula sp. IMCC14364]|uniref:monofunctional biosynthetic peptidoglycan transglycosylase n=1 Tax=Parvularcula sp. IMCC14364 TaxID=3067902 RepID=UPI0027405E11|nr:monofunctional biosynthetic peptidoglycan transglycosylase [Parvularcula sp. IMCC14364]